MENKSKPLSEKQLKIKEQHRILRANREYKKHFNRNMEYVRIPNSAVAPWLRRLLKTHKIDDIASGLSVTDRALRRLLNTPEGKCSYYTAAAIVDMCGDSEIFLSEYLPPTGIDGWGGEDHTACVECGSFFHHHKKDGYCEMCI
jgi:hypothetical protein